METVVYYRESNGEVLGLSVGNNLNIQSEKDSFGRGVGHLIVPTKPDLRDKTARVVNGNLIVEDDILFSNKKQKRSEALEALRSATGLTVAQMKEIFGG